MAILNRLEALELARMATLSGDYSEALHLVSTLLRNSQNDTEALCLKGNVLELLVFSEHENGPLIGSVRYDERLLEARECFEMAISIDPNDVHAIRDLADHLKGVGDKTAALALYDQLIDLLRSRLVVGEEVEDELSDAISERDECSGSL